MLIPLNRDATIAELLALNSRVKPNRGKHGFWR